jgi:hypothetical protein
MAPDTHAPWMDHRDELCARVIKRGRLLRWRRRAMVAGIAAMGVAVPVSAVAVTDADDTRVRVTQPGDHTGTTASDTTTITTAPTTTSLAGPSPRSSDPAPGTPDAPVSATAPSCRNAFGNPRELPECPPFSWASPPPTTPFIALAETATELRVRLGGVVEVAVVAGGPSGARSTAGTATLISWGEGEPEIEGAYVLPSECDALGRVPFGPWDPPPAWDLVQRSRYRHSYRSPGTYRVTFERLGFCPPYSELPGAKSVSVTVVVEPAEAATS